MIILLALKPLFKCNDRNKLLYYYFFYILDGMLCFFCFAMNCFLFSVHRLGVFCRCFLYSELAVQ